MIEFPSRLRYQYKTTPYAHQKRALAKLLKLRGRGALLMEMGTGKTKVAIDWAGIGFYNAGVRIVIVVAPLSVLTVWPRQIRQHSPTPNHVYLLHGNTNQRISALKSIRRVTQQPGAGLTWVLINYEAIWRDGRTTSVEEELIALQADIIIFDESHRLKSATSKQSKSAWTIAQTIPQRLLLTGTPITKAPLDIFGQFRAMDAEILGSNWYRFKNYYGVWSGWGRYQLRGYRHLKELVTSISQHSFKIKKEDCLDLPEKVSVTVPVTLSDKTMALYQQMAREMIIEIEETHATAQIILVKLLRLSQITSGFVKDIEKNIRPLDTAKLDACMDLLNDMIEEGHKVVIFTRFRYEIERLAEALTKQKTQYAILSGSVPHAQRDGIIQRFHTDPNLQVFVAQIQAGSLGIDLTPADVAIFFSLDYNAANYWQAMDRLHRIGQTRKVTYYHLVVPKTIDSVVLSVLRSKQDLANTIIHNPKVILSGL